MECGVLPRALKACGVCGAPSPEPRCEAHRASRSGKHKGPSGRGRKLDGRWEKLRARAIRDQPWCADCGIQGDARTGKTGDPRNPLTGDHVVPYSVDPSRAYDATNIVVRCRRCNSRKGS